MPRQCVITGKKVTAGNKRSHAMNATRRTFEPNLQMATLYSPTLDRNVKLRLSMHGLRTLEHKGGLDAFLLSTAKTKLETKELRNLKANRSGSRTKICLI